MRKHSEGEDWSGERVERWLRQSEGLARQLAGVLELLLDAARLSPGESVLDIGCGTGPTTYAAASAVGEAGRVCGLDISPDMLGAAAVAPFSGSPGLAPIDWVAADAMTWTPDRDRYDAVISRFGVMFFSDPLAAFTNLAAAARPGGRLAMAVWQRRDASELFSVPLRAATEVLQTQGVTRTDDGVELADFLAIDDRGPFSLHDADAVGDLLSAAGWNEMTIEPHLLSLPFGGGLDPAAASKAALDFGPTRVLLGGLSEEIIDRARDAIANVFAEYTDDAGHVTLSGAVNIVTAVRP